MDRSPQPKESGYVHMEVLSMYIFERKERYQLILITHFHDSYLCSHRMRPFRIVRYADISVFVPAQYLNISAYPSECSLAPLAGG